MLGEPEAMTKTVFDARSGEFLGPHMVRAEVPELIQGYVVRPHRGRPEGRCLPPPNPLRDDTRRRV
jgi:hypothetical protein